MRGKSTQMPSQVGDLAAFHPLFYIWKRAQTAPPMLMAAFPRFQQRLQPAWGEGGPAPCSLSTSSLPQHTDTACRIMIVQLRSKQFIVHASQLSYSKTGWGFRSGWQQMTRHICIHSTGFSKQCWMHQLEAQVVWLHLVLPWKDLLLLQVCHVQKGQCKSNNKYSEAQRLIL